MKIRDISRMAGLFVRLVYEMLKNYRYLNSDKKNNFLVCRKICKKVVEAAKIQLCAIHPEHIPGEGRFLLVSNHRCFFDVVFLLAILERPVSFVAAKELSGYPLLRKYLSALGCVMIDRGGAEISKIKDSVSDMKKALQKGNLVLFPEGECSYYDTKMREFKKGGFLCVPDRDTKIVPAFIHIGEMANIGRWMIPKGAVSVCFDGSFCPSDISEKRRPAGELARYAQSKVEALQKKFCV